MRREQKDDAIFGMYRFVAVLYDAAVRVLLLLVGGEKAWRCASLNLIQPGADEEIMELCCGTGTLTLIMSENPGNGANVHGSDLSPEQIAVAKRKARRRGLSTTFSARDASDTGYPGASFDKVVISGALNEIRKEKRMEIYREARRCLKPGGRICVSESDRPPRGWGAFCFRVWSGCLFPVRHSILELADGGLERELAEAGFALEEKRHSNRGIIQHLKLRAAAG